jgi:hypothetical protein
MNNSSEITESLPHALGPEKSALSTILQEPERLDQPHGLTEGSFYSPSHQTILRHIQSIQSKGYKLEMVVFIQSLTDSGELELVGGPAAITELYSYAPTNSHFGQHCKELHEKHAARLLYHAGEAAKRGDDEEHARLIIERDRIKELASEKDDLMERLESLRYDPEEVPPADETCLCFMDKPVGSRGNITALQAKQKAGKSAVISAINAIAAAADPSSAGDTLGFSWQGSANGSVLHYDTEQSKGDWHASVTRAIKRSGSRTLERLYSYTIVTIDFDDRKKLLQKKMKQLSKHGIIDCVIIDGIADFVADVNCPREATTTIAWLMKLAHEYQCSIIVVIHENPATDGGKTRGHLGSELQRKAFANIRIDKDANTGISTIYGTDMRKADIPKSQGLCFAWSDDEHMHMTLGPASEVKRECRASKQEQNAIEEFTAIYEYAAKQQKDNSYCPSITAEMAATILLDIGWTKSSTSLPAVLKRMQRAEINGVLKKTGAGEYTLTRFGQNGQNPGQ